MPPGIGRSSDIYTVTLICALPVQMAALIAVLDEIHDEVQSKCDHKIQYVLGRIGTRNVVVYYLAAGHDRLFENPFIFPLKSDFPRVRFALMVGIGEVIQGSQERIRSGNVVATFPKHHMSFLFGHDNQRSSRDILEESLGLPPGGVVGAALHKVLQHHLRGDKSLPGHLVSIKRRYPLLAHRFNLLSQHDDSDFYRGMDPVARLLTGRWPIRAIADSLSFHKLCRGFLLSGVRRADETIVIQGVSDNGNEYPRPPEAGWPSATAACFAKQLILALDDCTASTELMSSNYGLECDRTETDSSVPSSRVSPLELTPVAVTQLGSLLLNDHVLKRLFARAILLAGPVTLQKQLERHIRKYGRDLNNQASKSIQRQAAGFILHSARHTAVYMRRELLHDTTELSVQEEMDMRNAAQIDAWLESLHKKLVRYYSDRLFDDVVEWPEYGDGDDSASQDEIPLTNLDQVKEFIVDGHAISNLRHELQTWVEAKGRENGTDRNTMSDRARAFWRRLMDICSPPPAGYRRIHYLCGCGERVYVDVKEILPGGLNKFRARLLASVNGVRDRLQHSASSGSPQAPPQAHLRSSSTAGFAGRSVIPSSTPASYTPDQVRGATGQRGSATTQPEDYKFLLLCINTKTSTVLENLEVGSFDNDEFLFRAMSQEYRRVREEHEFKIMDIVPLWACKLIRNVARRLPHFVRIPEGLRYYMSGISLYKIHSADFVRFQLVPIGLRCCPTWFKTRDVPPEAEVKAKRYLYQPVPVDDVEIDSINNLEHLLKPGPHTDDFWLNRFPKKTCSPLERERGAAGQRVIGWGIRINEGLNLTMISLLVLVTLLGVGATVVIYAVTMSDNNSAFALGAFLVAVFAAYLGHQYFTWKQTV
ncbi:hypothetical protein BJX68DRAFT_261805 [Aspergillus pseudodeflectus]|uniref:Uncharacterized protein n=1 Tax=Aspergillus pseudodeflectus TaxID=176178 RepID=A0ABR4L4A4_9EURO